MIALDTNIIVYAEGVDDPAKGEAARRFLVERLDKKIVIPAQALAELYGVLVRKRGRPPAEAQLIVGQWAKDYTVVPMTVEVISDAIGLAIAHRIGWWDAIVFASAAAAGCRLLVSEDLQDGFTWRGVTVRNPFRA